MYVCMHAYTPRVWRLHKDSLNMSLEAEVTHVFAHGAKLMVTPHQKDSRRVKNFERKHERHNVELMMPAIYPVTIEDIGSQFNVAPTVRREAVMSKQQEQIPQLPMNIAENFGGRRYPHHRRLSCSQALDLGRQELQHLACLCIAGSS